MLSNIKETVEFLRERIGETPEVGIILGTGLGSLVNEVEVTHQLIYSQIPNFPISTTESHRGRLIFGLLNGKRVMVMQGRFHYYEGYSMQQVTFPVRVMKYLGVKTLFVSNASGGLNPAIKISELMILRDHINLLPEHPLRGMHLPEFGPRFPQMNEPYDLGLINKALGIAQRDGIKVHSGVYVAVQGPALETPAEYEYLRRIGGDAVGMSTVPEVIVARQMGMPCFAISVITDEGFPEEPEKVTIESIVEAAHKAEPHMTHIISELIGSL
ncbi:MAG: purine-nucleoside phosphorylase [Sphingobacteriaceae bacterium]|nr:purine-nucleoside phosphorylase [Sphingobacteriaceae bacterium]